MVSTRLTPPTYSSCTFLKHIYSTYIILYRCIYIIYIGVQVSLETEQIMVTEASGGTNICIDVTQGTVSNPVTVAISTIGGSASGEKITIILMCSYRNLCHICSKASPTNIYTFVIRMIITIG